MNQRIALGLVLLAGVVIGATGIQTLHAQAKVPLYLVSEIDVTNPDAYGKEYAPKAQALIKASGGRFVARLHQLDLIFAIFGAFDRDKRLILLS